jgi:23S rRNA (pseudouridine1915-N3)-methyltransferase
MKCRLIAAGTRMPDWVNEGFREYQKRLRTPLVLELTEIPVATRRAGENPQRAIAREGENMLAALGREDYVVALEVSAKSMSTEQLSAWLAQRLREGRPLALLIGGPDGLS